LICHSLSVAKIEVKGTGDATPMARM
jgi:hypothetical protein